MVLDVVREVVVVSDAVVVLCEDVVVKVEVDGTAVVGFEDAEVLKPMIVVLIIGAPLVCTLLIIGEAEGIVIVVGFVVDVVVVVVVAIGSAVVSASGIVVIVNGVVAIVGSCVAEVIRNVTLVNGLMVVVIAVDVVTSGDDAVVLVTCSVVIVVSAIAVVVKDNVAKDVELAAGSIVVAVY